MNIFKVGLISLALWANLLASSVVVTSDVTSNVSWKDTVFLDKNVFTVFGGARLTINPGTVVKFRNNLRSITVRGTITAVGTATDSIRFSHEDSRFVWQGIRFLDREQGSNDVDSSFLKYCILDGAQCVDVDSQYMRKGSLIFCGSGNYVEIGNSVLSRSRGYYGGAVYVDSGAIVQIENCQFESNTADLLGGGAIITNDQGEKSLIVQNCSFRNNYARTGGAVRIGKGTNAEFNNCIFFHDTTLSINPGLGDLNGGAMAVFGPADVTLRNCLIFHCRSYGKGGGIYSADASIKLINCTIARNASVYGGGIYFARDSAASSPLFVNTIEGGNGRISGVTLPHDSAGYGMFLDSSVTPIFRYCHLSDTVYDHTIKPYQGEFVNSRYYETDFLLRTKASKYPPTAVESYQLSSTFAGNDPGIDGGTPDTAGLGLPEFDVLGQKRIHGTTIDIGAIEYCDTFLVTKSLFATSRPQKLIGTYYKTEIYTLNGRMVGSFNEAISMNSVHEFVKARVSKGVYLVSVLHPGSERRLEKVLVK